MIPEEQERIDQLQEMVARLGGALSASERRTARLERGLRWTLLGLAGAAALGAAVVLQPLGQAVAQNGVPPSNSVEEALDRINQNLMPLGMMGQMMQAGFAAAVREAEAAQRDPSIQSPLGEYTKAYFADYLKAHKIPPGDVTPQLTQQIYQQAIMEAAGGLLVDAGVLLARLRQDSDFFRTFLDKLGGPNDLLAGIQKELHLMNGALASVPAMAVEMHAMTQQMGVMSYSVGSTMGRAGSWMPW